MQITTNNQIFIDGARTGFSVSQERIGTVVYDGSGRRVTMPFERYNLTTDNFLKQNVAGVSRFESDIRAIV